MMKPALRFRQLILSKQDDSSIQDRLEVIPSGQGRLLVQRVGVGELSTLLVEQTQVVKRRMMPWIDMQGSLVSENRRVAGTAKTQHGTHAVIKVGIGRGQL